MSGRRPVRVDPRLFDQIDDLLASERGVDGAPSTTDFLVLDLPPIIEEFAARFDRLRLAVDGRPDYRVLLVAGRLVPRIQVIGHLEPDGSILLMDLQADLEADW